MFRGSPDKAAAAKSEKVQTPMAPQCTKTVTRESRDHTDLTLSNFLIDHHDLISLC